MSEPLIGVTCDNDTPYGPCERDTGHAGECDAFGSAAAERLPVDPLREALLADVRAMNARVAALWWQPEAPSADYMDPRSHSQSAHIELRELFDRIEAALAEGGER